MSVGVLDSSSIVVNRRQRRAKTDRVDVKALLRLLQRYWQGERDIMSVVRVPTVAEEDQRRLNRERDRLLKERGGHSAWIKSLLVAHGVRLELHTDFLQQLELAKGGRMRRALGLVSFSLGGGARCNPPGLYGANFTLTASKNRFCL